MKSATITSAGLLPLVASLALLYAGCGQQAGGPSSGSPPVGETSRDDHSHGGWWCVEHGIPEEECSLCSAKAADEFRAKGDWCEEHNRADSQCFLCHPENANKFAKLYEAKFGQAPPEREAD